MGTAIPGRFLTLLQLLVFVSTMTCALACLECQACRGPEAGGESESPGGQWESEGGEVRCTECLDTHLVPTEKTSGSQADLRVPGACPHRALHGASASFFEEQRVLHLSTKIFLRTHSLLI